MNRFINAFLILSVLFCRATATEKQISLGIINGLNCSSVSLKTQHPEFFKFESIARLRYNILLYFDCNIDPSYAINSGVRFSIIKVRLNDNTAYIVGTEFPDYYTYDHYFLNLPLRLKWKLKKFYFVAGIEMNYLLSTDKTAYDYKHRTEKLPPESKYNKFNIAATAGIGYRINLTPIRIIIESGHCKGLLNVIQESRYFKEWKTNEAYLNLGLEYDL